MVLLSTDSEAYMLLNRGVIPAQNRLSVCILLQASANSGQSS